jgi:hypothetical protein
MANEHRQSEPRDAQAARVTAKARSLRSEIVYVTAELMGDPIPGRSALDGFKRPGTNSFYYKWASHCETPVFYRKERRRSK